MSTNAERIASVVSSAEEALFDKFDSLHKSNIHDDEVIHFLRDEGHTLLATRYIEWSGALDPDREDPSTLGDGVTDTGITDSDKALAAAMEAADGAQLMQRMDRIHHLQTTSAEQEQSDLEAEYLPRFLHDAVFKAQATVAGNVIAHLHRNNMITVDYTRSGLVVAAALDKLTKGAQ